MFIIHYVSRVLNANDIMDCGIVFAISLGSLLDTQRREYAIMILEDPVDLVIYRSTTLVTERTFYR